MGDYRPPLDDIRLVLDEISDISAICDLPAFEHVDVETIDGVLDARQEGDDSQADSWMISVTPGQDVRDAVSRAIIDGGFSLRELRSQDMSLEDIFLRLTTEETTV